MTVKFAAVRLAGALSLTFLISNCAGPKPEPEPQSPASTVHSDTTPHTSVEAKGVAAEQNAAGAVEITFAKQSAKLSKVAKSDLMKFLDSTRSAPPIEEIKTIAWGDAEYPAPSIKKLSETDVKLAEARNKAIQDFFKNQGVRSKITTYEMTKRPATVNEWLNTSDARIKKSLEAAGIPNTDTTVKVPSKAGKAMVLAIFK
jgi:hypothetical protein